MQQADSPNRVVGTYSFRAVGTAVLLLTLAVAMPFHLHRNGWHPDQGRLSWMPHDLYFFVAALYVLTMVALAFGIAWFASGRTEVVVLDETGVSRRVMRWTVRADWSEIVAILAINKPIVRGRSMVFIKCKPPSPGAVKTMAIPPWMRIDRAAAVRLIAAHRPDLARQAEDAFGTPPAPPAVAAPEPVRPRTVYVPGPTIDSHGWTG